MHLTRRTDWSPRSSTSSSDSRRCSPGASVSVEKVVESQARLPLESHPGTRFDYQVGYPVIGRILEIGDTSVIVENDDGRVCVPARRFIEEVSTLLTEGA